MSPLVSRSKISLALLSIWGSACSINMAGTPSFPKARSKAWYWLTFLAKSSRLASSSFLRVFRVARTLTSCWAAPTSNLALFPCSWCSSILRSASVTSGASAWAAANAAAASVCSFSCLPRSFSSFLICASNSLISRSSGVRAARAFSSSRRSVSAFLSLISFLRMTSWLAAS